MEMPTAGLAEHRRQLDLIVRRECALPEGVRVFQQVDEPPGIALEIARAGRVPEEKQISVVDDMGHQEWALSLSAMNGSHSAFWIGARELWRYTRKGKRVVFS